MIEQRDIIIIGGGVSGLLLAALLQHSGLTLAVIERQDKPPAAVDSEDLRQRAINPHSQRLLEQLQLWSSLTVSPYDKMVVWEEGGKQQLNFSADTVGQPVLGHIVSEQQIHHALYQHLHASETLKFLYGATPQKWHYDGTTNHLELTTGEKFQAPLIIAADGVNSWLRQQAAIEFVGHDYYQRALVANVTTARPHRQTAWQIFLPHGPLAFLPLTDPHRCAIVWSCRTSEAKQLLTLSDSAFCQLLADSFDHRLGQVIETSQRCDFALSHRHASDYVQPGLALIGDAAHRIHPLAGLGLNLGMADAGALAEIIQQAAARSLPIGHFSLLRRYQRQRRPENAKALWFVDQLKGLFANQNGAVVTARRQGLALLNQSPQLKRYFIHQAAG